MFNTLICLGFVSLMTRFGAWKNQQDQMIGAAQNHALKAQLATLKK